MKCVNKSDIERMTGSQLAELIMGPGELREPLNEQQVEALLNVQKLDRVPLENNPIVVENERGLTGLTEPEGIQEAQSHQVQNPNEHQSDQQQQTHQQPNHHQPDESSDALPDQVVMEISKENSDTSSSADHTPLSDNHPNGNSNVERDNTNIEESRVAITDAVSLGVQPNQPHQQSEFDLIVPIQPAFLVKRSSNLELLHRNTWKILTRKAASFESAVIVHVVEGKPCHIFPLFMPHP